MQLCITLIQKGPYLTSKPLSSGSSPLPHLTHEMRSKAHFYAFGGTMALGQTPPEQRISRFDSYWCHLMKNLVTRTDEILVLF